MTKRLPKYKRSPDRYGRVELTRRDLEILRLVHDYRFVTVDHVTTLVAGSRRQIQRRLQGMFHHSYLARLLPPLRVRLAADTAPIGSPKMAYALDAQGAKAIAESDGLQINDLDWRPRGNEPMNWFLEHRLMVSTFRAALEAGLRRSRRGADLHWLDEENIRDAVQVRYPGGNLREHRVAPDGYFAIRDGAEQRNFFLEVDRGTEEHPRLLEKFRNYWWYFSDGSPYFQRYPNPRNRLVLVVCSSSRRLDAMRATLSRVDERRRGLRQFWFTTEAEYDLRAPESLLAPIWRVGMRTNADARQKPTDVLRRLLDSESTTS